MIFRITISLILILLPFTSEAQRLNIIPFGGMNFGGVSDRYGLSRSYFKTEYTKLTTKKNVFSGQIGIQAEIALNTRFSITTGATYSGKGFQDYWRDKFYNQYTSKVMQHYLEVPLLLRYTNTLEPTKWYMELGPYTGFIFPESNQITYLNNKTDYGIMLGTGYKIKLGNGHLLFGLRWTHGLQNRLIKIERAFHTCA
jgi:hypothetical protein